MKDTERAHEYEQLFQSNEGLRLSEGSEKRMTESMLAEVEAALNDSLCGLDKARQLVCEHLLAERVRTDGRKKALLLVGTPGTGKGTIAETIAKALGRKFARIPVDALLHARERKGSDDVFPGYQPGTLAQVFMRTKTCDPVILLEGIDLLADADQPGSEIGCGGSGLEAPGTHMFQALRELLDPGSPVFEDDVLECPIDIREVLFIASATRLDRIPLSLLECLQVVPLDRYTVQEKRSILERHLIPKACRRYGLDPETILFPLPVQNQLLMQYDAEPGLIGLDNAVDGLLRNCLWQVRKQGTAQGAITLDMAMQIVGKPIGLAGFPADRPEVGVVNGLGLSANAGGMLAPLELILMPGAGKVVCSGTFPDVMRDAAFVAVSQFRAFVERIGQRGLKIAEKDIHLHSHWNVVPQDGAASGMAVLVNLLSAFSERVVPHQIAVSGEMTLHGRFLRGEGVQEKVCAAVQSGVKCVVLPKASLPDVKGLDPKIVHGLEIRLVDSVDDLVRAVFGVKPAQLFGEAVGKAGKEKLKALPKHKYVQ